MFHIDLEDLQHLNKNIAYHIDKYSELYMLYTNQGHIMIQFDHFVSELKDRKPILSCLTGKVKLSLPFIEHKDD